MSKSKKVIVTDGKITDAVKDIHELMARGYINADFEDLKDVIDDCMKVAVTTATTDGATRIADAFKEISTSPVWKGFEMTSADKMLIKIFCAKESKSPVRAEEIINIVAFTSKFPSTVDVKWSISDDPSLGDSVRIIVCAGKNGVTSG